MRDARLDVRGKSVLDVGCGTGFFTEFYLRHGARVTGLDIASTSIARLAERFPAARFIQADVSEAPLPERYDVVNAFDVLYHITDAARWEAAVERLAAAVAPGGVLLVTVIFADPRGYAEHNRPDSLERYRELLARAGITIERFYPTHVLLNRELGPLRFLNRAPGLLYAIDHALLGLGLDPNPAANKLMVARRTA